MPKTVNEQLLANYFLLETIFGKNFPKSSALSALGEVFCLNEGEMSEVERVVSLPAVSEIKLYSYYKCYVRVQNYNLLVGAKSSVTEEEEEIISVKGEAMATAFRNNFCTDKQRSVSAVYSDLERAAEGGNVVALRLLGILLYKGICSDVDTQAGMRNLLRAAKWCDKTAMLAVARYDESQRETFLSRLYTLVKSTPEEKDFSAAMTAYGFTPSAASEEVLLLKKIFNLGHIKPEFYNSSYSRIIYNSVISLKEKKRVLMSGNAALVSEVCSIPMNFRPMPLAVDDGALALMPVIRKKEQDEIKANLKKVDLRFKRTYRATCICSESAYLAGRYVHALCGCFPSANVKVINVSDLQEHDLQLNGNNAFIKQLVENENNVLIFRMAGNVHPAARAAVRDFLSCAKRENFGLRDPEVTLDLSSVLPVVVCDEHNRDELECAMEVVRVAPVKESEKQSVLDEIAARKARTYGLKEVVYEKAAADRLKKFTCESAENVVDAIVQDGRFGNESVTVTAEDVEDHVDVATVKNKFGFN